MKSPYVPSYERALQLVAAGCPLDYVENLPGSRRRIYIEAPIESRVIDLGDGSTRYVIGVRIGTDSWKGVTVADWSFEPPWDHHVDFNHAPSEIVPASAHAFYEGFLQRPLAEVFNEGKRITCRRPARGLLCGFALGFIPTFVMNGSKAWGKLTVTDDSGTTVGQRIGLTVDKQPAERTYATKRRARLFDKPDLVDVESTSGEEKSLLRSPRQPDSKQSPAECADAARHACDYSNLLRGVVPGPQ